MLGEKNRAPYTRIICRPETRYSCLRDEGQAAAQWCQLKRFAGWLRRAIFRFLFLSNSARLLARHKNQNLTLLAEPSKSLKLTPLGRVSLRFSRNPTLCYAYKKNEVMKNNSLPESYQTVPVPRHWPWWRKMLAFAGPGYLVAVGYMDPGNWATDLAGGSAFGYTLLSVILLSNLMAMLLQSLSAKLGIATGRDLAQACRDHFSRPTTLILWILCEIAICACDLAEIIGSAIALNLLFNIPLIWGVCLTALDVLIIMYFQKINFRYIEAFIITLMTLIAGCFWFEIVVSHPDFGADVKRSDPPNRYLKES